MISFYAIHLNCKDLPPVSIGHVIVVAIAGITKSLLYYFWVPGARLTKAYDVTIQIYRNSHAKIQDSKCISCGVWVQDFVWNFKGALWNFNPYVAKYVLYDVLEIWRLVIS